MVLAQKVGQKRSFGVGLLLTIVTFGVYAVFWNYRAHNELYKQFELQREGRDEGMVWYVLGIVLPPFLIPYFWIFAANVAYLRERIGLRRAMTPGRFVTLAGSGVGAFALGIIILQAAVVAVGENATEEETTAAVGQAGPVFLGLALLAAVLVAAAYHGLQRDINELWDAYDARMSYLARHPEDLAQQPAYMADLRPVAAADGFASPLRGEVERLRVRHPELRALGELDALIARAETGDAEARERGEQLLGDLAGVLQERAELLRRREERTREADDIRARIAAGTIFEEDLRRQLAELSASDIDERLSVLEQALFAQKRP